MDTKRFGKGLALALATVAAFCAFAAPSRGAPQTFRVALHHAEVDPAKLNVLTGDTVLWTNASFRNHTVTSSAGGFDSGIISSGRSFSHAFPAPGVFPYACKLHPSVTGEIGVYPVLLAAVEGTAEAGKPVTFEGRSAAGGPVAIEEDRGTGFHPVATATAGGDGSFRVQLQAEAGASYRAVVASGASPVVQINLAPPQSLAVSTVRRGRGTAVEVKANRAQPGATVVLQAFLRERFGWWPIQRRQLGPRGAVRFRIKRRSVRQVRALLVLPDGATIAAESQVLRLPRRR